MGVKICIDAGHYGKYNRSPAIPEYYESDMVWKLHLLQKQYLEEYEGVTVITTRGNQATDKGLYDRGACSRGCDLFISDHSNAVGSGVNDSVDYVAVYHLTEDSATRADDISKGIASRLAPVIANVMGTSQGGRIITRRSDNDRNGDGMFNDNYYGVLHGARMVNTPGLIIEHSFHTNTRMTRWLLDDGNLARLARVEADTLAAYFGLKKKGAASVPATGAQAQEAGSMTEKGMWDTLKGFGLNDFAAAGVMGNIFAESGLKAGNLQNSFNTKFGMTDEQYTAAVDNGSYSNFVRDSGGYGLCQWTYWTRKQALLEFARSKGKSIGDPAMQLEFFWIEVQGYKAVADALKNASSVLEASNAILHGYEKPADQSAAVEQKRAAYGQTYYDRYANATPTATVQPTGGFPYQVRVKIPDLYIRKGAGTNYQKGGFTGKGTFTIVDEADGQISSTGQIGRWGLLKSYQDKRDGWICLSLGASVTEKV